MKGHLHETIKRPLGRRESDREAMENGQVVTNSLLRGITQR